MMPVNCSGGNMRHIPNFQCAGKDGRTERGLKRPEVWCWSVYLNHK